MNFQAASSNKCEMTVLLRQSAFPDTTSFENNDNYIICISNSSSQTCQLFAEYPLPNTLLYLGINSSCNYSLTVQVQANCVTSTGSGQQCSELASPIQTYRFLDEMYFKATYYLKLNESILDNSLFIRNDKVPYFIEFLVDSSNTGGTLNLNIMFLNQLNNQSNSTFNSNSTNDTMSVALKACLLYNSMSMYKNCPDGYQVSMANSLNFDTNFQLNVAYPMRGNWFLAVWKQCYLNSKYTFLIYFNILINLIKK